MSRVLLITYRDGDEAAALAGQLRRAQHEVEVLAPEGAPALRPLRARPPEAVVVDLAVRPAYCRSVANALRLQKATRRVPIVFAGGTEADAAAARKEFPDIEHADWRKIRGALKRAIASPPGDPVYRDPMAGYSGTPLPKKLGIKEGARVALSGAPRGFERTLGELPEGVALKRQARPPAEVVVLFARTAAELRRRFPAARRAMGETGRLWLAWPKKTSPLARDLAEPGVREFGLESGLVDFKICAIDHDWSGLCFTTRVSDRRAGKRR